METLTHISDVTTEQLTRWAKYLRSIGDNVHRQDPNDPDTQEEACAFWIAAAMMEARADKIVGNDSLTPLKN